MRPTPVREARGSEAKDAGLASPVAADPCMLSASEAAGGSASSDPPSSASNFGMGDPELTTRSASEMPAMSDHRRPPSPAPGSAEVLTVAHLLWAYLPRTQTFVYELLTHFTDVQSAVVSEVFENLDLFPFEGLWRVPTRSFALRALDRLTYMASGRLLVREKRYRDTVDLAGAGLLHGHFGWSAPLTLPLRRSLGLPLVTTFYGYDMSVLPRDTAWQATYAELFDEGDEFLVEGHHMKKCLIELGCPENKVTVQHIGVDLAKIAPRSCEPEDLQGVSVLLCGSFLEKKGIRYAIEAMAKALKYRSDLRLWVVGDGPERPEYEALIDRLGVGGSIALLGYRTHAEYLELAKRAQIFLAPSVTASDGETEGGAPTVLIEMQAACLPVVSTLHADIPEVVIDGQTGFLVPERDSDALAERMLELADDTQLRQQMGLRGRLHVEAQHDIMSQAGKLEEIYRSHAG